MTAPRATDAPPAIAALDDWRIDAFRMDDIPLLSQLLHQRGHRYLLEVPTDEDSLRTIIGGLSKQPWSMPIAILKGEDLAGFGTTALPNLQALHASVAALFVDPAEGRTPLAMYLRHVFWSFPLRRLHTQVPELDLTREYIDLLQSVGFVVEGRLLEHANIGGQTFDVVALGLLRTDFEAWSAEHEPRLAFA